MAIEVDDSGEFTLETCQSSIAEVIADGTKQLANKEHGKLPKGMLKLLCRTERELTGNYGKPQPA